MQDLIHIVLTELRGAWRYRWAAVAAAWCICAIGWFLVMRMPNIYEARAQVYVDADSRLADVMGQVGVAPGVGSRVFVVRQAMLGRPQLEYVARETGLDQRAHLPEEYEALIGRLRENVAIGSGRSSESRNLFSIRYRDRDRQMAISVVQTLLDTFVKDVLDLKDRGAEEVTGYLQDQLAHYSDLLSQAERRLADFKKKNVGLLPGESGGIFERLQREMDALKVLETDLQIELDRRAELRRQLSAEEPYVPEEATAGSSGAAVPGSASETAIRQLESQRAQLLLTFTDRHPDVIAINEQLAQLYEQQRVERAALAEAGAGIEGVANATNPVYQGVQIALNESGVKIAGLRSQIRQREAAVREYRSQIETIPEVEATFSELTRDYAQYKALYQELLEQRERERMGTPGEDRDVVSFNITEPPIAGIDPVAPPRVILLAAVLVVGLGAGGMLAFVLNQMHPVFLDAKTLRMWTRRPVLGAVSITWLERHRTHWRVDLSLFAAASASLVGVCGTLIVFREPLESVVRALLWESGA